MSAGTSFPAVWFLPAETPLTRRLLVYFDSGAYRYLDVLAFIFHCLNYIMQNCI
jgi:hypothetical protein